MTANYIIKQLQLPLVGDIVSPYFTPLGVVRDGLVSVCESIHQHPFKTMKSTHATLLKLFFGNSLLMVSEFMEIRKLLSLFLNMKLRIQKFKMTSLMLFMIFVKDIDQNVSSLWMD